MISTTVKAIGTACTVAAALAVTIVPTAAAKDGDGVRVAGTCSDGSSSKLKVKHDDGRIEAEFEVDQNRNGVRWNVELRRNGRLVFSGVRTTVAPSGSFSLERKIAGGASSADDPRPRDAQRRGLHRDGQAAGAQRGDDRCADAPWRAAGAVKLRGDGSVDDNSATVDDHGGDRGSDDSGSDDGGSGNSGRWRRRSRTPRKRRLTALAASDSAGRAERPARGVSGRRWGFTDRGYGRTAGDTCEGVPTGFAAAALSS